MLIILEGVDGSGKTSLSNRIRKDLKQYSIFLRTSGPPSIIQIANIFQWLEKHPRSLPIVVDRHPLLSEYVYGPILRGECKHALNIGVLAKTFKDEMIIHCRPQYSTLEKCIRREVQLEGVIENLRQLIKGYDDMMGQLESRGVYIKRFDWNGPPQQIIPSIRSFIQRRNNAEEPETPGV